MKINTSDSEKSYTSETTQKTARSFGGALSHRGNETLKSARGVKRLYKVSGQASRDDINPMLDELYGDAMEMSLNADFRAKVYRVMHLMCTVLIMTAGAAVTALGLTTGSSINNVSPAYSDCTQYITPASNYTPAGNTDYLSKEGIISYIVGVLGLLITLLKGIMITFSIEKRAREFKASSIKLRKISRSVKKLKNNQTMSCEQILSKVDGLYNDIDDIEINIFSQGIGGNNDAGNADVLAMGAPNVEVAPKDVKCELNEVI